MGCALISNIDDPILNSSGLLYMISLLDSLLCNDTIHKCVRTVKSSSTMTLDTVAGLCSVCAPVHTHANVFLHAYMHANDAFAPEIGTWQHSEAFGDTL